MMRDERRDEILTELGLMEQTVERIDSLLREISSVEPSGHTMAGLGVYLANVYNGMENILKRILKARGVPMPDGPDWHVTLLGMFGPKTAEGLPQLFDEEMMAKLDTYRAFRHLLFHGYAIILRWDRLRPNAEQIADVFAAFRATVEEFLRTLQVPDAENQSAPGERDTTR